MRSPPLGFLDLTYTAIVLNTIPYNGVDLKFFLFEQHGVMNSVTACADCVPMTWSSAKTLGK